MRKMAFGVDETKFFIGDELFTKPYGFLYTGGGQESKQVPKNLI